jgi:hypothetical protein
VDNPTFPDKVEESRPLPTPYDQDDHMDTDSLEQLRKELYGNPSWVRWGLIQKGEGVSVRCNGVKCQLSRICFEERSNQGGIW